MRNKVERLFLQGLLLVAIVMAVFSFSQARASETKKKDSAVLGITLQVNGMTCSECAKKVESCLMKLKGVKKVSVDVDENKASVEYDTKKVSVKQMIKALKKKGYDAKEKKDE